MPIDFNKIAEKTDKQFLDKFKELSEEEQVRLLSHSDHKSEIDIWHTHINSADKCVLSRYEGDDVNLVLPDKINDVSYEISGGAFRKSSIESITISTGVTLIDRSAFAHCEKLKKVTFADGFFGTIMDSAFMNCHSLEEFSFPTNTKVIGHIVTKCPRLQTIYIPNSVNSIGAYAFAENENLKSIYFDGTKAQWKAIKKGYYWSFGVGNYTVYCLDGKITVRKKKKVDSQLTFLDTPNKTECDNIEIKEVYDEIVEESHKKKSFGVIDVNEFREVIIDRMTRAIVRREECKANGINPDEDPIYNEIINEKLPPSERPKRITREQRYILMAKKIRDINLNAGEVCPCKLSAYHISYKYSNLSFEEFSSYIYWRTQTRNHQIVQAPIPYIWLYLYELCNFIEFENIEEIISMLSFLFASQNHQRAKTIIREAMSDFLVYYGDSRKLNECDAASDKFSSVKSSLSFLNGTHPNPFGYIISQSAYRFKNSEVFKEYPKTVAKYFMIFFYKVVEQLEHKGIDLMSLWIGRYQLIRRNELMIRDVKLDLVVDKQLIEDEILLRSVTKDGAYEATMSSLGQDIDPGQCIFQRTYIIDYPIRFFDNELRKITKKDLIEVSTSTLHQMADCGENYNLIKIIEFYESNAFVDCLKGCLDLCAKELLQEMKEYSSSNQVSEEYIYCEVKFENTSRKFSYITEDESIAIGDMVVVPTGPYNFESIAVVHSIKRCTVENAPYPPSKTKKIIRKHIQ